MGQVLNMVAWKKEKEIPSQEPEIGPQFPIGSE